MSPPYLHTCAVDVLLNVVVDVPLLSVVTTFNWMPLASNVWTLTDWPPLDICVCVSVCAASS